MPYYLLMDSNCSIPECDAAPIAISLQPIKSGPGQWCVNATLDDFREFISQEFPLALTELEGFIKEVYETINVKGFSVDVFVVEDGTWSSWCDKDFSGMLSVVGCANKEELIAFLDSVPGF